MAIFDVNTALQEGIIPENYQNLESLSDLANIVLQGESYLNKSGAVKDDGLIKLGNRIFNEVSTRRYKYKYTEPIKLKDGRVLKPLVANPLYDPSYGQQQNSNSTDANKMDK